VDPHLRLSPEQAKQQRASKRAQRREWRQSHSARREAAMRLLSDFDAGEGIARVVEEIVHHQIGTGDAEVALALLGVEGVIESQATTELHRLARMGHPESRLRVAVALLMARAEVAYGKDRGDYRERDNVRAHFHQLVAHGYQIGTGELAQLAEPFGIDDLEPPAPTVWWCRSVDGETTPGDAQSGVESDKTVATEDVDGDADEADR
jgi:hypothetical protein